MVVVTGSVVVVTGSVVVVTGIDVVDQGWVPLDGVAQNLVGSPTTIFAKSGAMITKTSPTMAAMIMA